MTAGALARRFAPVALIAILIVAIAVSGVWRRLSLADLRAHHANLALYVAHHPRLSLLIYVGLFVAVVTACIPGPGVMCMAGGLLFGTAVGGAAALVSCILGSALVFLACRMAFGDWLAHRAGPKLARLEGALSRNAFFFLLTLRLVPGAPYFVASLAAGLARVRARDLLAATAIGSTPMAFLLAGLGAGLRAAFASGAKVDASFFARPAIVAPLAGLAILSLGPLLWRLYRARKPAR